MFKMWKKAYKSLEAYLYQREEYIKELEEKIRVLEVEPRNVSSVLPRVVYDKFKKTLPNSIVGDDSSAGAIGYKLGVAHVMSRMEEELVV